MPVRPANAMRRPAAKFLLMTKLEIVELEKQNKGVVNLYAEGSFYKAYEQSAFVLCSYVRPLKVSARPLKGLKGLLLSVGFPMNALEKWAAEAEIKTISDKCIQIIYPIMVSMEGYDSWHSAFENQELGGACAAVRHPRLSEEYYPVFGLAYRMTKGVTEFCSRLKRNYRYSLGEDLRVSMRNATIHIIFATKKGQLDMRAAKAIEEVEQAELALRLLNELGEISDERYTPFIDITNDIKEQLEKWARSGQSSQKTARVPS